MYNYLKCKYKLDISDIERDSINRDWEKIVFITEPIDNKVGEFLVRGNGELCHNITEYEKVDDDKIGEPGVVWNGKEYAIIKNTKWERLDYTGSFDVKTEVIGKKVDAGITINFEFNRGYVVDHNVDIVLIDNKERLEHDKKIKDLAIKRVKRYNSLHYRIYNKCIITPILKILENIRNITAWLQDVIWKLEQKIKKPK